MAKFKMKGDGNCETVEFEAKIDHDGDLLIEANGLLLMFIDSNTGRLELMDVYEDIPGISLVESDLDYGGKVIEIGEEE